MILVVPGKSPVTKQEKAMAQTSGHSLHLLPGDHQYDNPEFAILIVSNGYRQYCPTQFAQSRSLINWRLSLIGRHLTSAMDIFNVIEEDLGNDNLIRCFEELRVNITDCKQLLGAAQKGTSATVPDVHLGPNPAEITSATRQFPQAFEPAPLIRRNLPLDTGMPENPQTVGAVKSAGQKAPLQKPIVVHDKFFPVIPTQEVRIEEFNIPIDFSKVHVPRTDSSGPSTASTTTGPFTALVSTTPVVTLESTTSVTTSVTTILGTVVSSQAYKRFNCQKCAYRTDRRQDFENHQRIHEGLKVKCGHRGCKKTFWSDKSKKAHFKTVHMKMKRAKCHHLECDYESNDYGCLQVHLYYSHGEGTEPKCPKPECQNRKFTNYRTYERHVQSYHLPRDEQCPICLRWYKGEDNLDKHINEFHHGEDFICDICGAKLSTLGSYKTHKSQQHKGANPGSPSEKS